MTEAALQPARHRDRALTESETRHIGAIATRNGAIASVAAAAISSGAVFAANALSPRFRNSLGISGKAALVVTPTAGAFFLKSHLTLADAQRDPDSFVPSTRGTSAARATASGVGGVSVAQTQLGTFQSAANAVYNHPFKTILGIAAPIYAGIFYRESTSAATALMPLSQRLIHTRVYGQMVAVLSTVSIMAFTEGMKNEGGIYRIENGMLVRGEASALRQWYSKPDRSRTPQKAAPPHVVAEQRAPHEKTGLDSEQRRARQPRPACPTALCACPAAHEDRWPWGVPPERLNAMMMGPSGSPRMRGISCSPTDGAPKYEGEALPPGPPMGRPIRTPHAGTPQYCILLGCGLSVQIIQRTACEYFAV